MSSASSRTVSAYARALERFLEQLHGPPFVLSPRDWALAEEWHARGVPLAAVIECLDGAAQRRKRRGAVRRSPPRLADVARQVDETWSVVRAGRLPEISRAPASAQEYDERELWHRSRARAGEATPLGLLIGSLLARLAAGEPPQALDEALDRELPQVAPAGLLEEATRFVEDELAPFRGRWAEHDLRDARDLGVRTRLRRRLGLPRLSGPPAARERRAEPTQ